MSRLQKFVSELLLDFVVYGAHDLVEGGVFTGIPYSPTTFTNYMDWVYDTLECDLRLRRQDHPDLNPETVLDLCQNEQVVFDVYEFLEKVFPIMAALDHDSMDYHERYLSLLVEETPSFEPIKVEEHLPSPPPLQRQNAIDAPPLELDPLTVHTIEVAQEVDDQYNDEEPYVADSSPQSRSDQPTKDWTKKALLTYATTEYKMVGIRDLSKEKLFEVLSSEETRRPFYSPEQLRAMLQDRGVQLKAKMSKKQLLALF
jgi:hypothetical protein